MKYAIFERSSPYPIDFVVVNDDTSKADAKRQSNVIIESGGNILDYFIREMNDDEICKLRHKINVIDDVLRSGLIL